MAMTEHNAAWVKVKAGEYHYGDYVARRTYDRAAGGTMWKLNHPEFKRAVWFSTLADVKDHVADTVDAS